MFHEHASSARSKFNQTSKRLPAPGRDAHPHRDSWIQDELPVLSRVHSLPRGPSVLFSRLSTQHPTPPHSLGATFSVSAPPARQGGGEGGAIARELRELGGTRIAFREIESRFESAGSLSSNTSDTSCNESHFGFLFHVAAPECLCVRLGSGPHFAGIDDRSLTNDRISSHFRRNSLRGKCSLHSRFYIQRQCLLPSWK